MTTTHIQELYKGELFIVSHSGDEFDALVKKGWSPEKSDPDKVYTSVNDTPEAHKKTWLAANAKHILLESHARVVAEDETLTDKVRFEAKQKLNALKARRIVLDEAKIRIFGEPVAALEVPAAPAAKDKSPRKVAE